MEASCGTYIRFSLYTFVKGSDTQKGEEEEYIEGLYSKYTAATGDIMGDVEAQRLNLQQNESTRRRLDQHARTVGTADGDNKDILRQWIRGVDNAGNRTGALQPLMMEMVGYLVKGDLLDFMNASIAAAAGGVMTWPELRAAIEIHYLGEEEAEILRDRVYRLTQQPFESVRGYCTRFSAAVTKAYTAVHMGQDMLLLQLKRTFIEGLRNPQLQYHVRAALPADIAAAITAANAGVQALGIREGDQAVEQAVVHLADVPMIQVAPPVAPVPVDDPRFREFSDAVKAVKAIHKDIQSMSSSMKATKLGPKAAIVSAVTTTNEATLEEGTATHPTHCCCVGGNRGGAQVPNVYYNYISGGGARGGQGQGQRTDERNTAPASATGGRTEHRQEAARVPYGTSRCFKCGEVGHFERECPARKMAPQSSPALQSAIDMVVQAAIVGAESNGRAAPTQGN